MRKFNGLEIVEAADRNAGGYELGKGGNAEMNRAFNAFLDNRGVSRGKWGRNPAHVKPPTPPSDVPAAPRVRRVKSRVVAPVVELPAETEPLAIAPIEPTPEPLVSALTAEPLPVAAVEPALELPEAISKLAEALCDYAFCKACAEHRDASPEVITDFAEELLASFNLPEEILQTVEGR